MKTIKNFFSAAALLVFTSCSGTKTVLRYEHLQASDLKDGQVYEAVSKPFELLTRFNITVGINTDSIHVVIYGGGLEKGGAHFIRESDTVSKVIRYFRGEASESGDEFYAATRSTQLYRRDGKLFIRFNVLSFSNEYETEVKKSTSSLPSALEKFEKWAIQNKVPL